MALPKLLQALLILSLVPATAYAVVASSHPSNHTPASMGLATLSIVAEEGNATAIGHMVNTGDITTPVPNPPSTPARPPVVGDTEMKPSAPEKSDASVSISATVIQKNSSAVIAYNVTGGSLTIAGTPYQIVNGTGIFNQHSLVVVLHATVTMDDWTGILVLFGHTDEALSDSGSVSVTFDMPQSKLASKFFLELKGTLPLS